MRSLRSEKRTCRYCGIEFWVPKTELIHMPNRGKYCSIQCRSKAKENKIERTCSTCGKKFYRVPADVKRGHGKYCSKTCASKGLSIQKRKTIRIITCKYCGEQILLTHSDLKYHNRQFCSWLCLKEYHRQKRLRTCNYCGKEFEVTPYDAKRSGGLYCSRGCMYKGMKPSSLELILYGALKSSRVQFIPQHIIPEVRTIADAFLPEYNALIYVNGRYWHSQQGVAEKDMAKTRGLIKRKYKVFRLSEEQVNTDIISALNKVFQELGCRNRLSSQNVEPIKREVALELIKREKEARLSLKKAEHRCLNCGRIKFLPPKQAKRKYCSSGCLKEYHLKLHGINCLNCGKRFLPDSHDNGRRERYCSRECANLGRRKHKPPS